VVWWKWVWEAQDMATVVYPDADGGSVRPYGFSTVQTVAGTAAKYIMVPTDTLQIGYQVDTVTTGYFLEGSMSSQALVEADGGVFFDLLGNGTDAQTVAKQGSLDGTLKCVKLRGSAGGAAATVRLTFRRS
jgi:hypothetical protein